jgi:nuclear pore complex protein Nup98-Nup96
MLVAQLVRPPLAVKVQPHQGILVSKKESAAKHALPRKPVRPANPNAPKLTKAEYFTVPSIKRLQLMSDNELKAVGRFTVGRVGVGEVTFLYPTDLRGVNLDNVVVIEKGKIAMYPAPVRKPARGHGLNQVAMLTLKKIFPKGGVTDKKAIDKFREKLAQVSLKMHGMLVHYDEKEGVWIVKVEGF